MDNTMNYRTFGRLGWKVSEVGYGMWGIAGGEGGWTGSADEQGMQALQLAVDKGCNFFDTAWIYGRGHSEHMLGRVLKSNPDKKIVVATKIPPKNREWPSKRGDRLNDVFPSDHIREFVDKSLNNLGMHSIDLMQFHVWEDDWAQDESWMRVIDDLKSQKVIQGIGISVNRWEPDNVIKTLETGLIDSVQVIYNIFDQAPTDHLIPACKKHNVGVIARVPFDEGALTGVLTKETVWPEGDWRNSYFVPENLHATVDRVEVLKKDIPEGVSMAECALRFILSNPDIHTVIPGMRAIRNLSQNLACSSKGSLDAELLQRLAGHRWDRTPTEWSQ
jgi:aryl-alcohol dehydrogenase-like predicted oxidoreductase